jgi:hypothetical protein
MAVPTKEMMAQLMPDVLARIDDLNYEPDGRTPRLSVDASAMAREYARQRYRREQAPFREPVRPFEREPPPITEALDASREKDVPFTLVDEAQWASMTRVERDRLVQQATQRYRRPQQMPYAAALATAEGMQALGRETQGLGNGLASAGQIERAMLENYRASLMAAYQPLPSPVPAPEPAPLRTTRELDLDDGHEVGTPAVAVRAIELE